MARRIAHYLNVVDPATYPDADQARTVRMVNDILQGRGERGIDSLWAELEEKSGGRCMEKLRDVHRDIETFLDQRYRVFEPYTKTSRKQYQYRINDSDPKRPLKIVDQRHFDWAVKAGFPPDFFQDSYFDRVTICCVPDHAIVSSVFEECTFSACRLAGVRFTQASLYSCTFHSSYLSGTIFDDSTLFHTHFYDCTQRRGGFIRARLKSCHTLDCVMDGVRFTDSILDGCAYGRVKASRIRGLHTSVITQVGATEEECRRNREAIYKALSPLGLCRDREKARSEPER